MQKMDNQTNDGTAAEPEVIQAEVVEVEPGTPWAWRAAPPRRPQRRWGLPVAMFAFTCVSTWWVGTIIGDDGPGLMGTLFSGLRYAVPLMTILLCHEMGHFLQARRYGVYASLPYFIPIPAPPFGTLGAVIAMEPRIGGRRALFDIGITGPLAGLIPTMVFCIVGLHLTEPKSFIPAEDHASSLAVGCPLIFRALCTWRFGPLPSDFPINVGMLHPMAFAGWVGVFITALNLIPIGQLDGGHVLYAILRKRAHSVASTLLLAAIVLVIFDWQHLWPWTIMLILLLLIGPIHPPTANDEEPLGVGRILLGWLTLAFIVVGFTPIPIRS
ncbi:MAG: site-2 protease family protein [Planctomycetaceae bacterium]|nr:site-2 protease family protein [Planctomycetaceae bacterium]